MHARMQCQSQLVPSLCLQADVGEPVAIYACGKEHAMAVGVLKMSTADIRSINKGIGVDNLHHLNDGLWKSPNIA